MGWQKNILALSAISALAAITGASAASAGSPRMGCYERVYDSRHLQAHRGQYVVEATLNISPARAEQRGSKWGIAVNADLTLRVRGQNVAFETYGSCSRRNGALECGGSVSAAEEDQCRSSKSGVHNCRVDLGDAGDFRIETRPEGVVVSIPKRLELVALGSDTGPYLNLVSNDGENSDFLLRPSADACE